MTDDDFPYEERLRQVEREVGHGLSPCASLPAGFEPAPPRATEQRLADIEREIGFTPSTGNPLAQGLTARIHALTAELTSQNADLRLRLESLEGTVDCIIAALQKLRRSAFKRKP
jgi:hypothetical protein